MRTASRAALWGLAALLATVRAFAGDADPAPEQPVIALSFRGAHRAYPLTLFPGPRVVNDVVGSMEVAVYHDPARDVSAAWFRTVYGEPIQFSGTATGALGEDLTTATRWNLETGVAASGNLQGQRLVPLPFTRTTWAALLGAQPAAQPFRLPAP